MANATYNDFICDVTDGGSHHIIRRVLRNIESDFLKDSPECTRVLFDSFADNDKYFDYRVSFTKRLNNLEKLLKKQSLSNDNAINLICSDKSSGVMKKINSPESLAICCGSTTINSILLKTEEHCKELIEQCGPHVEKTILFLTNKWDEEKFRKKYVVNYINFACKYNFKFVILLVTDFGIIPVPFTVLCNEAKDYFFKGHDVSEIIDDVKDVV